MENIKIELYHSIVSGMPVSFRAPCDCADVTGLKVVYHDGDDIYTIVYSFADAHGNDLTGLGDLFAEGAMVRAILDPTNAKAYLQNADTNAYLEGKFKELGDEVDNVKKTTGISREFNIKATNATGDTIMSFNKNLAWFYIIEVMDSTDTSSVAARETIALDYYSLISENTYKFPCGAKICGYCEGTKVTIMLLNENETAYRLSRWTGYL